MYTPAGLRSVPEEYWPDVAAVDVADESDDESLAATQSLTSSVKGYVYENGRRYDRSGGSQGKYVSPNDETEQDRLDMQHHQSLMLLAGNLYTAPLNPSSIKRVLDCGTGTGIWALDFAETHPNVTEIIGVDLSPIQPSWSYSNVKFEVDDLEKPWTWPENYFDFIHARELKNGIRDYATLASQIYRHLAPGGFVELSEMSVDIQSRDGTYNTTTATYAWVLAYQAAGKKAGLQMLSAQEMAGYLEAAGFVDVKIKSFLNPIGPWPKERKLRELGAAQVEMAESGFDAYGLALLTGVGGLSEEEAKALGSEAFRELMGKEVHAFNLLHQVTGRKKRAGEA